MVEPAEVNEQTLSLDVLNPETRSAWEQAISGRVPVPVSAGGKITAVLVDAEEFRLQQRRLSLLERLTASRQAVAEGRMHTQEEAEERIAQ